MVRYWSYHVNALQENRLTSGSSYVNSSPKLTQITCNVYQFILLTFIYRYHEKHPFSNSVNSILPMMLDNNGINSIFLYYSLLCIFGHKDILGCHIYLHIRSPSKRFLTKCWHFMNTFHSINDIIFCNGYNTYNIWILIFPQRCFETWSKYQQ